MQITLHTNDDEEIALKIFHFIGESGVFIEFGAYDGNYLSATKVMRNAGWEGLYIEPNRKRFTKLFKNFSTNPKLKLLNSYVHTIGENSLDNIVTRLNFSKSVDFLVVDIDGLDLCVFESINLIRTKYLCIEYNDTIPNDIYFKDTTDLNIGSSALAVVSIVESKKYHLIGKTLTNLYFESDDLENFAKKSLNDFKATRRFSFSYQGELLYFNSEEMERFEIMPAPWSGGVLMQLYPKLLIGLGWKRVPQALYSIVFIVTTRISQGKKIKRLVTKIFSDFREYKNGN
jgi:hypothetical protein